MSMIRSQLSRLSKRLKSFLFPFSKTYFYQRQVDSLLKSQLKAKQHLKNLFVKMIRGQTAAHSFDNLESQVENPANSNWERGQACLVLSQLYSRGIIKGDLNVAKDPGKALDLKKRAQQFLGSKTRLAKHFKQRLEIIQKGGEPEIAFAEVCRHAANPRNVNLYTYSNQMLSYLYQKGLARNGFKIERNEEKVELHGNVARGEFKKKETYLSRIANYLFSSKTYPLKAKSLLKKIADTGHKETQYLYAELLEKNHGKPLEVLSYFRKAASAKKESLFNYGREGLVKSQRRLATYYLVNQYHLHDPTRASEYLFKAAKQGDLPSLKLLSNRARKDNAIASLQLGLIALSENRISDAEECLQQAVDQTVGRIKPIDRKIYEDLLGNMTSYTKQGEVKKVTNSYQKMIFETQLIPQYEQKLKEKLCWGLADHYESLLPDISAKNSDDLPCLEMQSIFDRYLCYLKIISPSSKFYSAAMFKLGHFYQYVLKDKQKAAEIFNELAQKDDQCKGVAMKLDWIRANQDKITNNNSDDLSSSNVKSLLQMQLIKFFQPCTSSSILSSNGDKKTQSHLTLFVDGKKCVSGDSESSSLANVLENSAFFEPSVD